MELRLLVMLHDRFQSFFMSGKIAFIELQHDSRSKRRISAFCKPLWKNMSLI